MNHIRKVYWLTIIGGLIVTIAGLVFLIYGPKQEQLSARPSSPNQQATIPSWLTYRDVKYGFEIHYPQDWVVRENDYSVTSEGSVVTLNSPEDQATDGRPKTISIDYYTSITDEPENKSNNLNAATLKEFVNKNPFIEDAQEFSLSRSLDQTTFGMTRGGHGAYYTVMTERNGAIYQILFGNKRSETELSDVEKQVLSTFTFIDPGLFSTSCESLADLSQFGKHIDEHRFLYFHKLPEANYQLPVYQVYLFDKREKINCLTKLDEVLAGGPGGHYDYHPVRVSQDIVKIVNRDRDSGFFWKDTRYYNLATRKTQLTTHEGNAYSITFQADGFRTEVKPDITETPQYACNQLGEQYEEGTAIVTRVSDILVNDKKQDVIPQELVFKGVSFKDCDPVTITNFTINDDLTMAIIGFSHLGDYVIDLRSLYARKEIVILPR